MIGVLCRPEENRIACEFFELFKTPWSFFEESGTYDVLLATTGDIPETASPVILVFRSRSIPGDPSPVPDQIVGEDVLIHAGKLQLPIYGDLLTFDHADKVVARTSGSELAVGIEYVSDRRKVLHFGYDLFKEVEFLLVNGQTEKNASVPTLDRHIDLLRNSIIRAGVPVVEIPPRPAGHPFIVCLTHDVDFIRIRQHVFDHTMPGYLYRASIGSLFRFLRRRATAGQLLKNWLSVLSLPLVHLGLCRDFWFQFGGYRKIEGESKSTFFALPFKGKPGEKVTMENPKRRAAKYDITDIKEEVSGLEKADFEIGLHGIDAWHSRALAKREKERIQSITGNGGEIGVRMHWLCFGPQTFEVLDRSGFSYDSSVGYNRTIGYRAGTAQVFRPLSSLELLELPMHIQDVALFYPGALDLPEEEAREACSNIIDLACRNGGTLTTIWHMRSIAPERLWDGFYIRLLEEMRSRGGWLTTAGNGVRWFRKRRSLVFEELDLAADSLRLYYRIERKDLSDKQLLLRVSIPEGGGSVLEYPEYRCVEVPLGEDEQELILPLNPSGSQCS